MTAQIGTPVTFQTTEITNDTVAFQGAPAIITGVSTIARRKPGLPPQKVVTPPLKIPSEEMETVEVVSLTVFRIGSIEYVKEIEAYNDSHGHRAGAVSYRAEGSEAPKVTVKK